MVSEDLGGGLILPHEHVFVDMRAPITLTWEAREADAVVALAVAPELVRARRAGVAAIVVCTPVGSGARRIWNSLCRARRVCTLRGAHWPLPRAVDPQVGTYGERSGTGGMDGGRSLTVGIGRSGVQAAWIKLSAGDDGLTDLETKVLSRHRCWSHHGATLEVTRFGDAWPWIRSRFLSVVASILRVSSGSTREQADLELHTVTYAGEGVARVRRDWQLRTVGWRGRRFGSPGAGERVC